MGWNLGDSWVSAGDRTVGQPMKPTEDVLEWLAGESSVEGVQEGGRSRLFHPFQFLARTFASDGQSEFRQSVLHHRKGS